MPAQQMYIILAIKVGEGAFGNKINERHEISRLSWFSAAFSYLIIYEKCLAKLNCSIQNMKGKYNMKIRNYAIKP